MFFFSFFFPVEKNKKSRKEKSLPGTTLDEDQRCFARPKSATLTAGVLIEEARTTAAGAGVAGEEAEAATKGEAEEAAEGAAAATPAGVKAAPTLAAVVGVAAEAPPPVLLLFPPKVERRVLLRPLVDLFVAPVPGLLGLPWLLPKERLLFFFFWYSSSSSLFS